MWPFFQKSGCFISQKYRESPLGVAKGTEIWSLACLKTAIPQKRTTWSPPALQVVVDLQPWGLQMAIFSYLLQHKECPNFSNQTTTFFEKRPDLSLPKPTLLRWNPHPRPSEYHRSTALTRL